MPIQPRKATPTQKATATRSSATAKPKPSRPPAPKSRKAAAPITPPASTSKQAQLLSLLQSSAGTTMAQMIETTGWQAHSIRGCISAVFRKKMGLTVDHLVLDTDRIYRITA